MIFLLEAQRSRLLETHSLDHALNSSTHSVLNVFPLLEPPETNPEPLESSIGGLTEEAPTLSETFRHSGWARARTLVYDALRRTTQSVSRILAFCDCGAFAYVMQSLKDPFEYRLAGSSCHDRFCIPCAKARSRVLASNVLAALGDQPVRFLTLTLRTNDGPLTTQIDRLYRCFTTLRNRAFWKKRVQGGCAFLEVKWSEKSAAWNVHIHCMLHGLYIPKSDLWRAWHAITGDSMIVDIRLVHDHRCIGRYVTKYVSKPLSNTYINRQPQFDELVQAMAGRRLCFTFGDWRGIKLTQQPLPGDWVNVGSFHDVLNRAFDGDLESLRAIRYICGNRTQELLDRVRLARPPPSSTSSQERQLYFDYPCPSVYF